jgi:hypothetical protein
MKYLVLAIVAEILVSAVADATVLGTLAFGAWWPPGMPRNRARLPQEARPGGGAGGR